MNPAVALTFRDPRKAERYAEALRQAGIEPALISPQQPRPLAGLHGLVLSGGTDLNPARYHAEAGPANEPPDDERDQLESELLQQALDSDLPVLAICRGMQLFNVVHGGTLIQHLDTSAIHQVRGNDPAVPVHPIVIEPGSQLAAILGEGTVLVNSRHHQGVAQVGTGLKITARSTSDNVIEALERPDRRFAVAVQWHPEDQVHRDSRQKRLFEAFAWMLR